jgi:HlyD family secretion protein
MKRWLIVIIIVIVVVGGFLLLKRSGQGKQTSSYRIGAVSRGTVQTVVSATGTASAVTTVQVGSQVSGTIQEIYVDFNSPVKKGQTVARLDPKFLQTSVTEAQAALEKAWAALSQAQRDSVRVAGLFAQNLAAQADMDNALTAAEQARAGVQQAEAQLWRAQTNLAYSVITAPIDGIVISRAVDVGQTVAASLQAPTLFTIAQDLHKMQIETSIDEADIGGLREGMKADFTVDSYPDEKFEGTIRQVRYAAKVDQNVVTYPVIIDVDNPDLKLRPGMTANVTVVTAQREDVLRIPATALRFKPSGESSANNNNKQAPAISPNQGGATNPGQRSGGNRPSGGWHKRSKEADSLKTDSSSGTSSTVYVKSPQSTPEPRNVRVGLNDGTYAEILGGELSLGDSVIVGMSGISSARVTSSVPGMGPGGQPRR